MNFTSGSVFQVARKETKLLLVLHDSSDLQLAIALQQQEFEQQQQQPQRVLLRSPTTVPSGLVVGPQPVAYCGMEIDIWMEGFMPDRCGLCVQVMNIIEPRGTHKFLSSRMHKVNL